MWDQLFLLGNLIIMVAYAAILVAITVPLVRAGQVRSNKLAAATALIFFSCSVGHGLHAWMIYQDLMRATSGTMPMRHGSVPWPSVVWDLFTATAGIYYWTLRRGYKVLLGKGAIYVDPWGQRRLAEADARERAARTAAEEHRATLAALVDSLDEAIIGATPDGTITAWNHGAERLFGWTAAEVIGRPATLLADRESATAEQSDVIDRIHGGERNITYEARRRHKDGSRLDIAFMVSAIEDHTGAVIGISAVGRDITAAKEAAERQRALQERTDQAQRMESLGNLAGGVAHDFNNILAIIGNYTEFAREQSTDPAVRADLRQVQAATERATNLTSQLLTFTRGDTIQPRDVDLNTAIAEVSAMLERTIGEHITLITRPAGQPVTVHADPGQIQQVLLNLAINARDAMPDGGTLVIEAGVHTLDSEDTTTAPPLPAGAYARLLVSDTGCGIPADVAAHIFEPFYTTKPRGQGTGLGLATVYGIITEAGGSITLYSEPDVGTTFRIHLPLRTSPADTNAARQDAPALPPDGAGRTVLVVEDEPALARIVARILTDGGYHALVANNGPEALDLAAEHHCDLVLTDVIMPQMSGRQLAQRLHEQRPGLPVVYMSGYSNGLLGTTHILDADVAFIEKPFTAQQLLHKIADQLVGTPTTPVRDGSQV
ncbi:hybrid sensor histidine kinase/response regulator [Actinoplanes utahensis]|uniref:histidine kinase n=1 Tax=Actinoplanes utahensis TaxID=1869 RepID=A0A0A6UQK2_ACTUT|nr:ATP-binding protein [Actinoplanes utahensis]KHD77288.1 histidine kinase [Actinoplanes utahensis]GIF33544.1 histidine kinase [Actinoplanes utahensis]